MERQQKVGAVVLAAGESRRFGSAKQIAELEGRSLLEHVLERASDAGLRPIVVVVPPWLTPPPGTEGTHLVWVQNAQPERGMSHSLRLGFASLPQQTDAVVVLLGDQPMVTLEHIQALVGARADRPFVATRAQGQLAPPVLVERSHFSIVADAYGDIGLREVLGANPQLVTAVDVPVHSPDVDTKADLDRLRRR